MPMQPENQHLDILTQLMRRNICTAVRVIAFEHEAIVLSSDVSLIEGPNGIEYKFGALQFSEAGIVLSQFDESSGEMLIHFSNDDMLGIQILASDTQIVHI